MCGTWDKKETDVWDLGQERNRCVGLRTRKKQMCETLDTKEADAIEIGKTETNKRTLLYQKAKYGHSGLHNILLFNSQRFF